MSQLQRLHRQPVPAGHTTPKITSSKVGLSPVDALRQVERTPSAPSIMVLQRTLGNQAVQRLLKTNQPHIQRSLADFESPLKAMRGNYYGRKEKRLMKLIRQYAQNPQPGILTEASQILDRLINTADKKKTSDPKWPQRLALFQSMRADIDKPGGKGVTFNAASKVKTFNPAHAPHHYDDEADTVEADKAPHLYDDEADTVPHLYDDEADKVPHLYDDEADTAPHVYNDKAKTGQPHVYNDKAKTGQPHVYNDGYDEMVAGKATTYTDLKSKNSWYAGEDTKPGLVAEAAIEKALQLYANMLKSPKEQAYAVYVDKKLTEAYKEAKTQGSATYQFLKFMEPVARKWLVENVIIGFMHHGEDYVKELEGGNPTVTYLKTDDERDPYHVEGQGGRLMYDRRKPPAPLDTTKMNSLMSGSGYGIYAMSPDGDLYAGEHRGGKFHHSSFLAGGDIAGAGEFSTTADGTLKEITTKSGHYFPTVAQLAQTIRELKKSMSLSGVTLKLNTKQGLVPYPFDADHFMKSYKKGLTADDMMAMAVKQKA